MVSDKVADLSKVRRGDALKRVTRDQELLEALEDLLHDLGKHIYLPLALLPPNIGELELRRGAEQALLKTRRGPSGVLSAAQIWRAFLEEAPQARELPGFSALEGAVDRALSWQQRLPKLSSQEAEALRRDLAAVSARIRALLKSLSDG